jgi:hypothetical protein
MLCALGNLTVFKDKTYLELKLNYCREEKYVKTLSNYIQIWQRPNLNGDKTSIGWFD